MQHGINPVKKANSNVLRNILHIGVLQMYPGNDGQSAIRSIAAGIPPRSLTRVARDKKTRKYTFFMGDLCKSRIWEEGANIGKRDGFPSLLIFPPRSVLIPDCSSAQIAAGH